MADDITLTVRVRDLTQADFNRIAQRMNGLRSNIQGMSSASADAARNSRQMRAAMTSLSQRMTRMANAGSLTRREFLSMNNSLTLLESGLRRARRSGDITRGTFREMRRDLVLLRSQLILLGRQGSVFTRLQARARLFQDQLRRTADSSNGLRRAFARTGDFGMRGMLGAAVAAMGLAKAFRFLVGWIKLSRRWTAILIATLLLIGPAAQALGVLLLTALGGAFIALGAFALRGSADVKNAFNDMKDTVSSVVREAAQPMRTELVLAMENVGHAAREMQPTLTAAFAAAGPLIDNLFGGLTDLLAHALPGFTTALQNSGQAMAGFRTAMGLVGQGFGEMFRIITQGNEDELERAWIILGNELRNLLVSLGEFISTALNSETATMLMIAVFRTATGALNIMGAALDVVDGVFGKLFRTVADGVSSMGALKGLTGGIGDAFKTTNMSIEDTRKRLDEIKTRIAELEDLRDMLPKPSWEALDAADELNRLLAEQSVLQSAVDSATAAAEAAQQRQVKTVQQLYEEMFKLSDAQRGSVDAQSRLEEAFDAGMEGASTYAGKLKVVNGEFDLNSKGAREVWTRLSDVISATKESTQAAIDSKSGWDTVLSRWTSGRDKLIALAKELNVSEEGVRILTEEILGVPDKTAYLKANAEDLKRQLADANRRLRKEPKDSRQAKIRAEISALRMAVIAAERLLNGIQDEVVNITINRHVRQYNYDAISAGTARGGLAHGGVAGAASGGPRSRMTLVGEHGPELVDLSPGSRVRSAPDTKRAFAAVAGGSAMGHGGGGAQSPIQIQLMIGDKYLGEVMVDPLRKAVRTRGGNVQAVLGQRGA